MTAQIGTCIHICRTPMECIREEDAGVRWCFGCRAHLPHTDRLMATIEPSYYDPHWARSCNRCGHDRTAFPRSEWA